MDAIASEMDASEVDDVVNVSMDALDGVSCVMAENWVKYAEIVLIALDVVVMD